MGEEPWRIHVTGDPALDLLGQLQLLSRDDLGQALGVRLRAPLLVVTCHPVTLAHGSGAAEVDAVLGALRQLSGTIILTYPNADPGSGEILERLKAFASDHSGAHLLPSLGQRLYYSLLACADVMIGNSSSGIWEAPSFRLPVVNVGERQRGRLRAANVIDCRPHTPAVEAALKRALAPDFRQSLAELTNPYGDGQATPRITSVLKRVPLDARLIEKQFAAYPPSREEVAR
jgi:UDP-N-acetylglucosamine 2-epimerase (non-hydrolysing)